MLKQGLTHYKAGSGRNGHGKGRHGWGGDDIMVKVPPGTVVRDEATGTPLPLLTLAPNPNPSPKPNPNPNPNPEPISNPNPNPHPNPKPGPHGSTSSPVAVLNGRGRLMFESFRQQMTAGTEEPQPKP